MARTPGLTSWEWLKIAEAAGKADLRSLHKKALAAARADRPLSIGERLALAKAHQSSGNDSIARGLVREMLTLPSTIWAHCDDSEEALTFCMQFDPAASVLLIKSILHLEETSWHDVRAWLDILIERSSEAEVLAFAEPLFLELSKAIREAGAEDSGWQEIAAGLMESGWFDDYEALLILAANEERWLGERVYAYGLVIRHAPASSSAWRTAGMALEELGCDETIPAQDRSHAARRLRNLDLNSRRNACSKLTPRVHRKKIWNRWRGRGAFTTLGDGRGRSSDQVCRPRQAVFGLPVRPRSGAASICARR